MKVPAEGWISQSFGANPQIYSKFGLKGHEGTDIACNVGTPVYAPFSGKVTETRTNHPAYGKMVRIVCSTGSWGCILAHLSEILVKRGQKVRKGELVGKSGNTGRSTGAHLHWSVYPLPKISNGYAGCVDPMTHLEICEDEKEEKPVIDLNAKIPDWVKDKYNLRAYAEFNNNEETWGSLIEKFKEYVTRFNNCKDDKEKTIQNYEEQLEEKNERIAELKEKNTKVSEYEQKWQTCTLALKKLEDEVGVKTASLSATRQELKKALLTVNTLKENKDILSQEKKLLEAKLEAYRKNRYPKFLDYAWFLLGEMLARFKK